MQSQLFEYLGSKPNDIAYTPDYVVDDILSFLPIDGNCLDPCAGNGAFYNKLPAGADYCEIREQRDFFSYKTKKKWIIGNPPYSIFLDFLKHSFSIADNVVYIVPTNKIFQTWKVMDAIDNYGGIKLLLIYGEGKSIGLPFGFSTGVFHFKKKYNGKTDIIFRNLKRGQKPCARSSKETPPLNVAA